MKITKIEAKKFPTEFLPSDGRIYLVKILGSGGEHLRAVFGDRIYAISEAGSIDVGAAGSPNYQILGVVTGVDVRML